MIHNEIGDYRYPATFLQEFNATSFSERNKNQTE